MEKEELIFRLMHEQLLQRINELMKAHAISQKSLADLLDKSPSEVNKWLHGDHNFTLRSIAKLEAALRKPLIHVAESGKQPTIFQPDFHKVSCHLSVNRQRGFDRVTAF